MLKFLLICRINYIQNTIANCIYLVNVVNRNNEVGVLQTDGLYACQPLVVLVCSLAVTEQRVTYHDSVTALQYIKISSLNTCTGEITTKYSVHMPWAEILSKFLNKLVTS